MIRYLQHGASSNGAAVLKAATPYFISAAHRSLRAPGATSRRRRQSAGLRALSTTAAKPPFDKILIANRGEIACRVIRTAKLMGIKTVALYSDIDDGALHMRMADEAVNIGKAPARQSYLDIDKVMGAVKKTGAQAVHPGYGFLSENMEFAAACEEAGVKFIGPPSHAIEAMGDKIESKKIAANAGVSTIPGFKGVIDTPDDAIKIAREIGYPVMIKASAGGGGKGMRIAYDDDEVREGFKISKREAMSSFNDDRMLVEKYIVNGHHIEIQVMADGHGNVVAFPERECSVQRRNQKVVEESPSCLLDPATRRAMQEQAIMLSKAVNYQSAGTVEMLVDDKLGFYFLEMNTRLQVEHPVTECISGADLVKEMINVAAGLPLSPELIEATHIPFHGHAIEARVYAEDPFRNFLPSTGPLVMYRPPTPATVAAEVAADLAAGKPTERCGPVRVDGGVDEGSTISMFYDPLISKLITYGETRESALHRMGLALDSYVIQGVGNNVSFLRDVCRNERFAAGKYSTSFIPQEYPEGFKGVKLSEEETHHLVTSAALIHLGRAAVAATITGQADSYAPAIPDELVVVLGGPKGAAYRVKLPENGGADANAATTTVTVTPEAGDGAAGQVSVGTVAWQVESPLFHGQLDGQDRVVQYRGFHGEGYDMAFCGSYQHVVVRTPQEHELSRHMLPPVVFDHSKFLLCPMPGTVISVSVKEGQTVEDGQELAVVEAMKMQNVLRAEQKGVVKKVNCKAGDTLRVDAVMIEFDFHADEKEAAAA